MGLSPLIQEGKYAILSSFGFQFYKKTQGEIMRKKDFVFFGNVRKDTKIGPACLSQSDRYAFVIDGGVLSTCGAVHDGGKGTCLP